MGKTRQPARSPYSLLTIRYSLSKKETEQNSGKAHVKARPGQRPLLGYVLPLWRQRRVHRGAAGELREEPGFRRSGVARVLPEPRRRRVGCEEERRRRVVEGQELADPGEWRTGLGARRQLGPGREARREEDQGEVGQ